MKSKLVKYPYDEKKYRWDTQKMGKEFEYSWEETEPGDYDVINPYIEYETTTKNNIDDSYGYINLTDREFAINQRNTMTYSLLSINANEVQVVRRPETQYKVEGTITGSIMSAWNMTNTNYNYCSYFPIGYQEDYYPEASELEYYNNLWHQVVYEDTYNAYTSTSRPPHYLYPENYYGNLNSGVGTLSTAAAEIINESHYTMYNNCNAYIPTTNGYTNTNLAGAPMRYESYSLRNRNITIASRTLYYTIVEYQIAARLSPITLSSQPTLGIERTIYSSSLGSSKLANIAYENVNGQYNTIRAVIGTHKTVVFGKNQNDCASGVAKIQAYLNSYNTKTSQLISNMVHVDINHNDYATKINSIGPYLTYTVPDNWNVISHTCDEFYDMPEDIWGYPTIDGLVNLLQLELDNQQMSLIQDAINVAYNDPHGQTHLAFWFLELLSMYCSNNTPFWAVIKEYEQYTYVTWCYLAKLIIDNTYGDNWQLRCDESPIALTSFPTLGVYVVSLPSINYSVGNFHSNDGITKTDIMSYFSSTTTVSNISARWDTPGDAYYRVPESNILTNYSFDSIDHIIKTLSWQDDENMAELEANNSYIINRLYRRYGTYINNEIKRLKCVHLGTPQELFYLEPRLSNNMVYLDIKGYEITADNYSTVLNNLANRIQNSWVTTTDIGDDPFSGKDYLSYYNEGVLGTTVAHTRTPVLSASAVTFLPDYLIKIEDWNNAEDKYILHNYDFIKPNSPVTILKPIIQLIGDETDNTITIPEDNTDIYSYTIGEPSGDNFNPKSLQINAPTEYDSNGDVISRTWLTYNTYTASQWLNGYHFEGNWNHIGSPYAYVNAITEANGDRTMMFQKELCPAGKYMNVFNMWGDSEATIEDSLGNTLSASPQVFHDNCGGIWGGLTHIVKSTDRHAYPDDDTQDGRYYVLQPQLTKFLQYLVSPEVDELTNVELFGDRYHYTHDYTEWVDRSWEGTICGSSSSTGEETIPDGTYRTYKGLYLGESIPFLHIIEETIPDSVILGVPEYDKQINTSDTLKYGTVAAASLTVQLDEPVATAINHSGELYVAYYDYFHNNNWDRVGFFRVDSVEAIDEYSSRLTLHDEVYKLNKYADDFLETYTGSTTLDGFYRDLLDYCGCWYDTHSAAIKNGAFELDNVYHAIKTTGLEVAHYIAVMAPGYIHANIDGDVELCQYRNSAFELDPSKIANIVYNAYNTDMLDKVRIVANNSVLGEDTANGTNIYFISNNPLISSLLPRATLDDLADDILNTYEEIQAYRPAEIDLFYLPDITTGDMPTVITPTGDVYKIAVMAININEGGVKITSLGTQYYPVESEDSSQFINLINDIDNVSGDVSNLEQATTLLGQDVAQNTLDIATTASTVSSLEQRVAATESGISTLSTNLQNKINNDAITSSNNLTSIKINGTTVSNIIDKTYAENNTSTSSSNNLGSVSVFGETLSNIALKAYVDNKLGTSVCVKHGTLYYTLPSLINVSVGVFYIGTPDMNWGIYIPKAQMYASCILYRVVNGSLTSLLTQVTYDEWSDTPYTNVSFVED